MGNLFSEQYKELLKVLKNRFEGNMNRHKDLQWAQIESRVLGVENSSEKLYSLNEMEKTGGEPDVIGYDDATGGCIFCDCSAEAPKGRRRICYDRQAQESRKEFKPENNAVDMADSMGLDILSETQYRELQKIGEFDTRTSCWLKTPSDIRKAGGALFGDRRYGHVFVYHNGAASYFSDRGFRGTLKV